MFQIRAGTFETNSSSAHSLVIKKDGLMITSENFEEKANTYVNRDGRLRFWDSELEFDRSPFKILTSVGDKLAYVSAAYQYNKTEHERILSEVRNRIPSIKTIDFPSDWETKEPFYGDIDHQSIGMLPCAVKKEEIDPVDIILDTRYIIIVDGDEYCVFNNMIESGLIDMSKIEKTYGFLSEYCEEENV